MQDTAKRIIERFELQRHPEGGYFREVYRAGLTIDHPAIEGASDRRRSAGTFIYFMLTAGDFSAFHRVSGSDEIWHLYAGGPLELHLVDAAGRHVARRLTTDPTAGEPAAVVPADWWQAARLAPDSAWAFCGCTVTPGFDFRDFEMPAAEALLEAFPAHAELIRSLTHR
jgi:predicted cupin superfamily sugar epimerase